MSHPKNITHPPPSPRFVWEAGQSYKRSDGGYCTAPLVRNPFGWRERGWNCHNQLHSSPSYQKHITTHQWVLGTPVLISEAPDMKGKHRGMAIWHLLCILCIQVCPSKGVPLCCPILQISQTLRRYSSVFNI